MSSFNIAGKQIGGDAPVYFIAELSANHGQKLENAIKAVEAAAEAGADAIKLQTYTPDTLTLKSDAAPFIVKTKNVWAGRTLHDLYAEAMTPWAWHQPIFEAAQKHGLACFSTPFDATAAHFLDQLGAPAFKIASFELTDLVLVETVARLGKPMIMSTGMASLADIEAALRTCHDAGNRQVSLLRCVSAYPADPATMDLRSMRLLGELGAVLGLSDHTRDNIAALAAVSLGAKLIEKHFIVDRSWGGPDSFFSLEPAEFKKLVTEVRTCEAALGKARFGPSLDELGSLPFRRSLFVARDVAAGSVLTCDDVRSVRPSLGIAPRHLPEVLGRVAARPLKAAEPLGWDMVGSAPVGPALALRPATRDDANLLRSWRNDPQTRANSRSSAEVGVGEHGLWLDQTLTSNDRKLFVAMLEGTPVGQLRLDLQPHGAAEISLTLAPEVRGKGLSVWLLRAGADAAAVLGVTTLTAVIRTNNERSVRAFKRAGYYGFAERASPDGQLWHCQRRIVRFAP